MVVIKSKVQYSIYSFLTVYYKKKKKKFQEILKLEDKILRFIILNQ